MERHRVPPGATVDLASVDARAKPGFDGKKADAQPVLADLTLRLRDLQQKLYAQDKHRLLVVLQAIDTGGKDGTIRHVFHAVNPLGVKVSSFKGPSKKELAHDYLWRVHPLVPGNGEISIFNRSHYEDVLVVRVKGYAPEEVWSKRYEHINDFERMLADEGTTIVKFYLHISKEEQRERLQERVDNVDKQWKFNPADLDDRARWDDYMEAFQVMLERTSTEWAPWYLVPADRKWYRNLVVGQTLVDTLEGLGMSYPGAPEGIEGLVVE